MVQNTEKTKEIKNIYAQISRLINQSEEFGKTKDTICGMERGILTGLLEMGAELLKIAIASRSTELSGEPTPASSSQIVDKGTVSYTHLTLPTICSV